MNKKTIGIFIDHDLFIRNFLFTKVFSVIEKYYKIIYIFPNESNRPGKRRRISKDIFKKLNLKNKVIVNIDYNRHRYLRYFHMISNLFFSKYKFGLDKKAYLHFNYHNINSRTVSLIYKLLSIYPLFYLTSWVFKKFILKENTYLKDIILKNSIDLILHPTAYEGFFDSDLIDLSKKIKIPSIFLMNSWDNTNLSGMTHGYPTKYLVWGKKAKKYAEIYKKIPKKNIEIIGSAQFTKKYDSKNLNYKKLIFNLKIVYRPHPWKKKNKNEKHFLDYSLKNVILDPFSRKNYNSLFKNKYKNKGIISSLPNESGIIIKNSLGLIAPLGTLMLESCWNKLPCCAFYPSKNWDTELSKQFKYALYYQHIQDFLLDLKIPLIGDEEKLYKGIDFVLKKKKKKTFCSQLYKRSQDYLNPNLNYKVNLYKEIKKII